MSVGKSAMLMSVPAQQQRLCAALSAATLVVVGYECIQVPCCTLAVTCTHSKQTQGANCAVTQMASRLMVAFSVFTLIHMSEIYLSMPRCELTPHRDLHITGQHKEERDWMISSNQPTRLSTSGNVAHSEHSHDASNHAALRTDKAHV